MNQKALKTLEFDKIIHRLTEHAASVGAKKKCTELVPVTSLWEIERAQTPDRRRAFAGSGKREVSPSEVSVISAAL